MKITKIAAFAAAVMILSVKVCADDELYASEIYSGDPEHGKREKQVTEMMLDDGDKTREYFDAVTKDMSWYTSKTSAFTLLDVTGDGYPELVVTEDHGYDNSENDRFKKVYRRFYSLKDGKAENMYDTAMSRNFLTPYFDENGVCSAWLYSDTTESAVENGDRFKKTEYGLMYFGEDSVRKSVKFSAVEKVDGSGDAFICCYKKGSRTLFEKTADNWSKRSEGYEKYIGSCRRKWYTEAGEWEAKYFNNKPYDILNSISAYYDSNLKGYGLYYIPDALFDPEKHTGYTSAIYGLPAEYFGVIADEDETEMKRKEKDSELLRMNIAELCNAYASDSDILKGSYTYKK